MRLNLGCGGDQRARFVNIDLAGGDLVFDLRQGLPDKFTPNSVEYIYSSHFLEHILDAEAEHLLKACCQALQPGGIIRLCLPDFKKLIAAYYEQNLDFFTDLPQGKKEIPLSYLEYCAYQYSNKDNDHKALYDFTKISSMLRQAGFVNVQEKQFDAQIDIPEREKYSLYVEGQKVNKHMPFMAGKSVLFALTVHNRLAELKVQEVLIRQQYGKNVGLQIFANCPLEEIENYRNLLEDRFHWCLNRGHALGALDHVNMIYDNCENYDYIIVLAAKTVWTDYSLFSIIIQEMVDSGKEFAAFADRNKGHFDNEDYYAFFCDFMVFSTRLFRQIFPVKLDPGNHPEKLITKIVLDHVKSKENIYFVPCVSPENTMEAFVFSNILQTGAKALSTRDFSQKKKIIEESNPVYAQIINKLIKI